MATFKLERKLYSEDQYINEMIEKAFCDGYAFAQRMYAGGTAADFSNEFTPEQFSKDWLHRERREKEMAAAWGDNAVESTRAAEIKTQPQAEVKPNVKPKKGTKAYYQQQIEELQGQLKSANTSSRAKMDDLVKNSEAQSTKIKDLEKKLKEQSEKAKGLSGKEKAKLLQQGRQKGRRQVGIVGGIQNQWRKASTMGKAGMVGGALAGTGALVGAGALIGRASKRKDD